MAGQQKRSISRRGFIRRTGRLLMLAGLGGLTGKLLSQREQNGLGNQDCLNQFICRNCRAVPECRLPQAMSFKQAGKRDKAEV